MKLHDARIDFRARLLIVAICALMTVAGLLRCVATVARAQQNNECTNCKPLKPADDARCADGSDLGHDPLRAPRDGRPLARSSQKGLNVVPTYSVVVPAQDEEARTGATR